MPSSVQSQYTHRLLLGFEKGIFTGRTTGSSQLPYDNANFAKFVFGIKDSNTEVETLSSIEYLNTLFLCVLCSERSRPS